jgi:hypothetical protein
MNNFALRRWQPKSCVIFLAEGAAAAVARRKRDFYQPALRLSIMFA